MKLLELQGPCWKPLPAFVHFECLKLEHLEVKVILRTLKDSILSRCPQPFCFKGLFTICAGAQHCKEDPVVSGTLASWPSFSHQFCMLSQEMGAAQPKCCATQAGCGTMQ